MTAKFIVIEGIDGCGKTSAITAVGKKFPNIHITREPGGPLLAEKIREILLSEKGSILSSSEQMDLFFAARQIHILETIKIKRDQGTHVISDRFDASTFAFQKCIEVIGERSYINNDLYDKFFSLRNHVVIPCEPSLYIYMKVDPEEGMKRRALARNQNINHFDLASLEEQKRRDISYHKFFEIVEKSTSSRVAVIDANQSQTKTIDVVVEVVTGEVC